MPRSSCSLIQQTFSHLKIALIASASDWLQRDSLSGRFMGRSERYGGRILA
ncbi:MULTISPECIES: hypothetical protein [Cyanophyceae]|uniref:Uncharacterized protein n=1 Tax=Scytonema millei VB511283 TaxID=1245923 RepID=A0A9X5E4D3_9CYAN|nr:MULTISPECIES: hypothetical protein [Cyanophyceae]MBE9019716.1 hypothetical protein [Chroococcidiopsidales cyanobacterium LEGE 13417]NHC35065.1 hypothetical protein [Scytonema millei VB511283]URD52362.1 hypothetical protein M5J74_10280 [Chroococcidiopsis sp. CCNUC1]